MLRSWKQSTSMPIAKNLYDFRPVALISIIAKCMERLVCRPRRVLLSLRSSSSARCCEILRATMRIEAGRCIVYPCRLTHQTRKGQFTSCHGTMNIRHRNNDMCSRSRGQPVVTAGFVALAVVPMMVAVAIWAAPTLGPSPPEQLLLTVNRSHFCPLCEATARQQRGTSCWQSTLFRLVEDWP